MLPVGFQPMISVGERPQTYVLDRATTGTGRIHHVEYKNRSDISINRSYWSRLEVIRK